MLAPPHLLSVATAVPSYRLRQADVKNWARTLFDRPGGGAERLLDAFDNAGIDTRYSCVPLPWYDDDHGWREKNELYIANAVDLGEQAARRSLQASALSASEIDAIVMVSTSGIATPSLDARLAVRLGLRADVQRTPIFGLGCAGGVLGLARAGELARAAPGRNVLLVVVELCGLTFRRSDISKSNVIATALFGDGAAAAVISTRGDGPVLSAWGEHTWPDSLSVMGWSVEDDGLGVLFSRHIPDLVREQMPSVIEKFFNDAGIRADGITGYVCHPGGAKVIVALEEVFGLSTGGLKTTREVLRDYGNMSAASVMFVLERTLAEASPGTYLATALGPGFTAALLALDVP